MSKNNKTFLIIILALGLRLITINQSFWLDEAVQAWLSSHFNLKDLIAKYMVGDFNPPLYHFLTWGWARLFSNSEISLRTLPLLFSLGSILLTIKSGEIIKKNLGLIAGLLLATSPLHIYYSIENRMYMLSCFGASLAFYGFLKLNQQQSWKNSVIFTLGLLTTGFSHFLACFIIPIFFIFNLKNIKRAKFLLPFLILGLSYLIYLPLFIKQIETGVSWTKQFPVWAQTVGSFSIKAGLLLPVKFIIGRISFNNKLIYYLIGFILTIIFWGTIVYQSYLISKEKIKTRLLLISLLFIPPAVGFLISFKIPVFSYFRFLFVLPFFYLIIGLFLISKKGVKTLLFSFILGINITAASIYIFNPRFHREDWRSLSFWLNKAKHCSAVILGQVSKPLEYYSIKNEKIIVWPPDYQSLEQIENQDCLYLVEYGLPIFDSNDKIRATLSQKGYQKVLEKSFIEIKISKYDRSKTTTTQITGNH